MRPRGGLETLVLEQIPLDVLDTARRCVWAPAEYSYVATRLTQARNDVAPERARPAGDQDE